MHLKNTEKHITFTVPIEKEVTRVDKNGEKNTNNISYLLQFIERGRFMASSLSIFSTSFLKEFIELNVELDTMIKNVKHAELNISIATVLLNIKTLKMIQWNTNVCIVAKIINTSYMKS